MRYMLAACQLLCNVLCMAQLPTDTLLGIIPLTNGTVIYESVEEVDSASARDLYERARRWFMHTYNSGSDVIQLDDPDNHTLIARGAFTVHQDLSLVKDFPAEVQHMIEIQCRDGRYRVIYSRFEVERSPIEQFAHMEKTYTKKFRKAVLTNVNAHIIALHSLLTDAMSSRNGEDW